MAIYVGLLRAVNVGGTGKLPMSELRRLCEDCGFARVQTYIASGNVVFEAVGSDADVQARLQSSLEGYAGKPVGVLVRSGAEMAEVLKANSCSFSSQGTRRSSPERSALWRGAKRLQTRCPAQAPLQRPL